MQKEKLQIKIIHEVIEKQPCSFQTPEPNLPVHPKDQSSTESTETKT